MDGVLSGDPARCGVSDSYVRSESLPLCRPPLWACPQVSRRFPSCPGLFSSVIIRPFRCGSEVFVLTTVRFTQDSTPSTDLFQPSKLGPLFLAGPSKKWIGGNSTPSAASSSWAVRDIAPVWGVGRPSARRKAASGTVLVSVLCGAAQSGVDEFAHTPPSEFTAEP